MAKIFHIPVFPFPQGIAGGSGFSESSNRSQTQTGKLGATAIDPITNNIYMYVKAGAAIAATDAVRFQGSALGFDDVRPTSAVNQPIIGIADVAFASGDYGWILVNGVTSMKTTGTLAVNVQLSSNGTAGTGAAYAAADICTAVVTVLVNSASPQVVRIVAN